METLNKHFKSKKDKNDFFIALVVIALFLGGILCAIFCTDTKNATLAEKTVIETNSENKNNINTAEVETLPNISKQSKEKAEDVPALEKSQEKQINSWVDSLKTEDIQNTLILPNTQTNGEENIKEIDENYSLEEENITSETETEAENQEEEILDDRTEEILEEGKEQLIESTKESLEETNQAIKDSLKESSKESNQVEKIEETKANPTPKVEPSYNNDFSNKACVIMVGAFSDGKNAAMIIDRLQAEEFVVYSSYRKGYRTVGIRSSCDKKILNSTLSKIQKNYAKDAFIIK